MAVALHYEQVAAFAPMTLYLPELSEQGFVEWCEQFPDFMLEYSADGELSIMPPTSLPTGDRNNEISRQLGTWAIADGRGKAYDSSTGFLLPSGARRAPDASWLDRARRDSAFRSGLRYPVLAPDFVIELKSPSDRMARLTEKMLEWMENGAKLGWLIDPDRQTVTIFRPGRASETLLKPLNVAGEGPVAGFVLGLDPIWNID